MLAPDFYSTRMLFQRGLALVYAIAFVTAIAQFRPLLSERGLEPAPVFMRVVPWANSPSLFYLWPKDAAFAGAAWFGLALSVAALAGITERFGLAVSLGTWLTLWALHLSFVNVGQTFYGFGWEILLLEAGFLAVFLGDARAVPSAIPMWLLRWLEFRVMFGAGLIKLRGDACWRDLSCLDYHYETQPMPNPLSWYFHHLPRAVLHGGVAFNHFVELILPFGLFLPQPFASVAGAIIIVFQATLMLSGNLSYLNLLTMVVAIPALDGRLLASWVGAANVHVGDVHGWFGYAQIGLAAVVGLLSIQPALNLVSSRQIMNTSFDPLHLVNTYGAFGSISRTRYEVVVEGTSEAAPVSDAQWKEYEFKGKPGDPMRTPPQIAPYHLRLDWLMWFAAMGDASQYPWFGPFVDRLLQNDAPTLGLLRGNPFPKAPPRWVRARLFRYRFTTADEKRRTGAVWVREYAAPWYPPTQLEGR